MKDIFNLYYVCFTPVYHKINLLKMIRLQKKATNASNQKLNFPKELITKLKEESFMIIELYVK